jgi:hypothetical protein
MGWREYFRRPTLKYLVSLLPAVYIDACACRLQHVLQATSPPSQICFRYLFQRLFFAATRISLPLSETGRRDWVFSTRASCLEDSRSDADKEAGNPDWAFSCFPVSRHFTFGQGHFLSHPFPSRFASQPIFPRDDYTQKYWRHCPGNICIIVRLLSWLIVMWFPCACVSGTVAFW